MIRPLLLAALQGWGRTNLVPGYFAWAVERLGPRLAGGEDSLPSTLPNGVRIRCDLRDHIQRAQWFFGAYEPVDSYLVMKLLRPGMNVVDAGANVGQYSVLASTAVGPSGSVHAFEPIPTNLERIRWAPALLFYFAFPAGLIHFALMPALAGGSPMAAFVNGALLGLLAYGTYDLANYATLRRWTLTITLADLVYGSLVAGVSTLAAYAGVVAMRGWGWL